VVEDVHWADDATLEFLLFLTAQQPRQMSLLLTCRPYDVPAGFAAAQAVVPRPARRLGGVLRGGGDRPDWFRGLAIPLYRIIERALGRKVRAPAACTRCRSCLPDVVQIRENADVYVICGKGSARR
jgi:hypothetical protein